MRFCIMMLCIGLYGCGSDIGNHIITGPPGSNGHNVVFSEVNASTSVCPTGGYLLSIGVDLNDNSILDVSEVENVLKVCNGATGTNGSPSRK